LGNSNDRDVLEFEGIVEDFSNGKFKVRVNENHLILCTLSGKIRQNAVKIILGDKVRVEASVYDSNMGRITYREKS
jgi:translation initiation factor IF-1